MPSFVKISRCRYCGAALQGPLLLDDGFRRVLKLLSGDHGVSLFYNARAKRVRIKGMTSDVHETVVAILRTTLDSRLSQVRTQEGIR